LTSFSIPALSGPDAYPSRTPRQPAQAEKGAAKTIGDNV